MLTIDSERRRPLIANQGVHLLRRDVHHLADHIGIGGGEGSGYEIS